jgi:hypothetical protein
MIINIFSIPSISDELEKVFFEARRTVIWDKGQIKPEIIEMKKCLKHWKKKGILDIFFEETVLM